MKKLFIIGIAITFFIFTMLAFAGPVKDIKGWNGAKWGMKETDLKNVFKKALIKMEKKIYQDDNTIYYDLQLKNFKIGDHEFNVSFLMSASNDKLVSIQLNTIAIASNFSQFEQLLIDKYGSPTQKDETIRSKKATWFFPSTQIELWFSDFGGVEKYLNIIYSDRTLIKKNSDKL